MKKAKSILAFIIAAVMIIGTVTASSALEINESVTWSYDGPEDAVFSYQGDLPAKKVFKCDNSSTPAFSYYPDETGYYKFTVSAGEEAESYGLALDFSETFDRENAKAHGSLDYIYCLDRKDYSSSYICYLPAEEEILVAVFGYDFEVEISSEYYGSEITEVSFANNALDNFIIDCDIPSGSDEITLLTDATLTFNSGKTAKSGSVDFKLKGSESIKEGSNEVEAIFLNKKFDETVTAYNYDKYVKSLELTNCENYCVLYENYHGFLSAKEIPEEYIIVTFADGSGRRCLYADEQARRVECINGRSYYVFAQYDLEAEKLNLCFSSEVNDTAGKNNFIIDSSYDCTVIEKDFDYNLELLRRSINFYKDSIVFAVQNPSVYGYTNLPKTVASCIKGIFDNIIDFCAYFI